MIRHFLPGMLLDVYGNLWVDLSHEGAIEYLARRGVTIPLGETSLAEVVAELAHLGVRRARPFYLLDN